ncbi:hypothetical protein SO802_027155 [Lithocarpus litseifolius]|uniref:Uncharacterized protein n=1 Tax=Lithocarpus litseifolius TaxID=425828 RepID=A0AAW2C545_9ROSI
METKLSVSEMQPIKAELDFPSMLVVPSVRRSGGLALLWKNEVVVDTQTYSPNHIDAHVSSPIQALWRLTGVYGHPEEGLKTAYSDHDPILLNTEPTVTRHRRSKKMQRIHEVRKEINELMHHEEVFWRQRSRSIWLPAGDKNTKFFHQRASQRQHKSTIEGLNDTSGRWCTDIGEIADITEEYYKRLFTASNNLNMGDVLASVDRVVTGEMARKLVRPYTEEEVQTALFQMHPSKAPSPDGMSPFFFQRF